MTRTTPDHGRRGLLTGRPRAGAPIRPPWTDEARLAERCTQCAGCLEACPEGILVPGQGGFPAVDFARGTGECTFCGACAAACPEDVFDTARTPPWPLLAAVSAGDCLAHAGVHCEACRDACPETAIRFAPRLGGPPVPDVEAARCTGCGACTGACPADAIRVADAADTRQGAA